MHNSSDKTTPKTTSLPAGITPDAWSQMETHIKEMLATGLGHNTLDDYEHQLREEGVLASLDFVGKSPHKGSERGDVATENNLEPHVGRGAPVEENLEAVDVDLTNEDDEDIELDSDDTNEDDEDIELDSDEGKSDEAIKAKQLDPSEAGNKESDKNAPAGEGATMLKSAGRYVLTALLYLLPTCLTLTLPCQLSRQCNISGEDEHHRSCRSKPQRQKCEVSSDWRLITSNTWEVLLQSLAAQGRRGCKGALSY
jgi:hypothetical protein